MSIDQRFLACVDTRLLSPQQRARYEACDTYASWVWLEQDRRARVELASDPGTAQPTSCECRGRSVTPAAQAKPEYAELPAPYWQAPNPAAMAANAGGASFAERWASIYTAMHPGEEAFVGG